MTVPSLLKNRTTTAKDFADEVIKIAGVSRNEEETLSVECLGDLIASIHSRLNDPVAAADFLKPFLTELHEETTIRLICELAPSKVFKTPFFERLGNFVHDAATSRNVLNMNVILKNLYKDTIRNKAFRKIVTATLKEEISKPARNFLNSVFPQKSAPSKNASSFSSNHNAIASSAQLSLDEIGDDLDKIDKDFESSSSSASSASSSDVGFGAGSGHSNSAALEMDLLVASDPYSTETLVKLAKKGSPDQINQWFKVAPPTLFNLRSTQLALLQAITDTHEANLRILMEKITRLYPKGMNLDSLMQSSSSAPSASSSSSAAAPTMDVESPTLNQPEIEDPEIWDWDP
ncbi:MAG TPA: hypothetical protein VLE89_08510 [Chlamydiales bacterium]|nr:hypothetical protein [Chlamydiales bacterium]